MDGLAAQIDGGFVADAAEAEGVVGGDAAGLFHHEEFLGVLAGREVLDALAVEGVAFDGLHAEGVVVAVVVFVFGPGDKLFVEALDGGEIELADEKLVAHGAEEALHFALGGTVAHGGVAEAHAEAGADGGEFGGGVDGAVVDVRAFVAGRVCRRLA